MRVVTGLAMSAGLNQHAQHRFPTLKGICFDMDGTLTLPNLDFATLYRRCGIDDLSKDILREVLLMPETEARKANQIIEEMEEEGRRTLQLMPGAKEVERWCQSHEIPIALVTRNTKRTVDRLSEIGFHVDLVISRDSDFPPKPDPAALHHIAQKWNLDAPDHSLVMVGDSLANDVGFGKAAGTRTILLDTEKLHCDDSGNLVPDIVAHKFIEIPRLLWDHYEIDSTVVRNYGNKYPSPEPSTKETRAAFEGKVEDLKVLSSELLDRVDPQNGNTPIIFAADAGHYEVVQFLLREKVRLDVQGYLGATAVSRAARRGHSNIVRLLAKHGADLDIPNQKMQYPLHFAAFKQKPESVQALLECGANRMSLDRKGRTADQDTSCEEIAAMIKNFNAAHCIHK